MRYALSLAPLMIPFCLGAQMLDVQPGARIRVTAPGVVAGRIDATVVSRTGDSIVVATPSLAQYRFGMSSLASLEVYQGRSHLLGAGKGALWGGGIMLPFALLGAAKASQSGERQFVMGLETGYAGVGAIIGSIIGADSWSAHGVASSVSAGGGALHLGLTRRF